MLTEKMGGLFDCRAYDQSGKQPHDQRRMLADTDNITFSAMMPIDKVPECFKQNGVLDEFIKPKPSKQERDAAKAENREPVADCACIKFKIGANCRWYGADEKPIARPTNAELEAGRWNVQIDFNRKAKDPSKPLKPAGYWCNAIMVQKIEENPFAGQGFIKSTAAAAPTINDAEDDGLPFD